MPLRILLVDDHEVVRLGLKALLSDYDEFDIIGEAATADEALEKTLDLSPDVVVMDIRLPGKNGIEATREIMAERPDTKVIILTSFADEKLLFDAINAGASGYVLKQIGSNELVESLISLGKGHALLDPNLIQKVFQRVREANFQEIEHIFVGLNSQEQKILVALAEGKTNKAIAAEVFLSEKTVRNYVSAILAKLNVKTRAEAAAFAVKHNIQDYMQRYKSSD